MEPLLPVALLLLLLLLVPVALLARRPRSLRTPPLRLLVVAGSGGHTTEILRLLSCLSESYSPRHYILADSDEMSEAKIRSFEQKRAETFSNSQFTLDRIPRSREVRQSWSSSVVTTLYSMLYSLPLTYKLKPDLNYCPCCLWTDSPTLKRGLQVIQPFGWVVIILVILAYLKFKLKTKNMCPPHSRKLYIDCIQALFSAIDALCNWILCNGPGTCVPVCISALLLGLLGIKRAIIVYVESICRVETLSLSGKILYYFSDYFIVQWPGLKEKYPKSVYLGRIV